MISVAAAACRLDNDKILVKRHFPTQIGLVTSPPALIEGHNNGQKPCPHASSASASAGRKCTVFKTFCGAEDFAFKCPDTQASFLFFLKDKRDASPSLANACASGRATAARSGDHNSLQEATTQTNQGRHHTHHKEQSTVSQVADTLASIDKHGFP